MTRIKRRHSLVDQAAPFCQHWGDPSDCDDKCRCGHECRRHDYGCGNDCDVDGCDCKKFEDEENNERITE